MQQANADEVMTIGTTDHKDADSGALASEKASVRAPACIAEVRFASQTLWLDGRRALFWPAEKTLVVADLHLGKGADLSRHSGPLPQYDTLDTLHRLDALMQAYDPQRVVCLGDSFHSVSAAEQLSGLFRETLLAMVQRVGHWLWVLGNHDPALPASLGGEQATAWYHDDLCFLHEPQQPDRAEIIGHFHPKATIRLSGRHLRQPCFWLSSRHLLLPAFGAYTGGLDIADPAISDLLPDDEVPRVFLTHAGKTYPVPASLY